jgi:hypothetical protein
MDAVFTGMTAKHEWLLKEFLGVIAAAPFVCGEFRE